MRRLQIRSLLLPAHRIRVFRRERSSTRQIPRTSEHARGAAARQAGRAGRQRASRCPFHSSRGSVYRRSQTAHLDGAELRWQPKPQSRERHERALQATGGSQHAVGDCAARSSPRTTKNWRWAPQRRRRLRAHASKEAQGRRRRQIRSSTQWRPRRAHLPNTAVSRSDLPDIGEAVHRGRKGTRRDGRSLPGHAHCPGGCAL